MLNDCGGGGEGREQVTVSDGGGEEKEIDGKWKEKMMVCEEFQTLQEMHQMSHER